MLRKIMIKRAAGQKQEKTLHSKKEQKKNQKRKSKKQRYDT